MEIDIAVVLGLLGTLYVFTWNWVRSVEQKSAKECERRLSRLEAIVNLYVLDVPKQEIGKEVVDILSYLRESDKEIFGKNLAINCEADRNWRTIIKRNSRAHRVRALESATYKRKKRKLSRATSVF
jgi:hypothetical protein